jgi:hypothetical protein
MALYKDLVNCPCGAKFDPKVRWVRGYMPEGTTSGFVWTGNVQPGCCPVCSRRHLKLCDCGKPAKHIFSSLGCGDIYFCVKCAKKDPTFGKKDPGEYEWRRIYGKI